MVSGLTIGLLVLKLIVCLGVPIGFFIFYKVRYHIQFQPVGGGIVVFIVFALILEQILHMFVLKINPVTAAFFKNPFAYAVYAAAAAALFEECGRFCAYKTVLKKYHRFQDGIAYGIGHGGFEMLYLGALSAINTIIAAVEINGGTRFSKAVMEAMQGPSYTFGISIYERCVTFCFQIGLSLVVLYGVANRKSRFLLYAILLHMASDIFAGLYQAGVIGIMASELAMIPFLVFGIVMVVNAKKIFSKGTVSGKQNTEPV